MDLLMLSLTPAADIIIMNGCDGFAEAKLDPGIFSGRVSKKVVSGSSKKMNLKVSLHKSTNRFLFAEVKDEFLELLFSFLMIPLGGVEFLLEGKSCLRIIDNLYQSVMDFIEDDTFTTQDAKNWLINPKLAYGYFSGNQVLPLAQEKPPNLFYKERNRFRIPVMEPFKWSGGCRNYVKKPTICFVTDDLTFTPSLASAVSILNGFGIALSDVKEMEFHIGGDEAFKYAESFSYIKNCFN